MTRIPDNSLVICPNCVHEFRAIPVDVQAKLATLRERVRELERLAAVTRISIPTNTMEQEFATHYRRGYEKAKRELESAPVADEVEAMASYLIGGMDDVTVAQLRRTSAMLRSLSRQIATKDAEIARLSEQILDWVDDTQRLIKRAERAKDDGKAAFDLSVECRARAVRAEAECDAADDAISTARKP